MHGRKRAWNVSWDAGSSRGSGGASGTCRAGGAEARGEALRVAERGRQTEVWGRTVEMEKVSKACESNERTNGQTLKVQT